MIMTIKAKDKTYEYDACGRDVEFMKVGHVVDHGYVLDDDEEVETSIIPCPRPAGHPGHCRPTIPLADFKAIATSNPTEIKS